jgi:hypothetical protein
MSEMELTKGLKQVGRLDLIGGGQVVVEGNYAFVGHMKPPHGTSIIDVSNPKNPKTVTTIMLPDNNSHTHKVRVVGDIMIVNVEMNDRHFLRKGEKIPAVTAQLEEKLKRPPNDAEVAAELHVKETDLPRLRDYLQNGYKDGGFRIYDVKDRANPKLLAHHRTHGFGTHRFDMDERYAYISTEMPGYVGNILMVYDIKNPAKPEEVSRWWMPGQHIAGGEKPTWRGYSHRLHHAMRFGSEFWASVWFAGFRVLDCSDITKLKVIGQHNYHPPFPEPTHTVVPLPKKFNGRRYAAAVDEEHDHIPGQPHAGLWFFDVEDVANIKPVAMFHLQESASPFSRATSRFGAHQFQERIAGDTLFCTWFSGGLRMIDVSDPTAPQETGWYIPEPAAGLKGPATNDVFVDKRELIYIIDRDKGFDIIERTEGAAPVAARRQHEH